MSKGQLGIYAIAKTAKLGLWSRVKPTIPKSQ